jgi:hypothetical protein
MLNVICSSWNPGVNLLRGHFQHLRIKLRKTRELTSVPPMVLEGRHTTTFMPMNNESLIQSQCLKPSLELKTILAGQWCTYIHESWYLDIHWPYSMNAEYFLLRQLITVHLWNSNTEKNPKLLASRKHSWLALFGTEYLMDTDPGNILKHTCAPTLNPPTEWLWSMNINYFGVSKFLGFHLRKVPFSRTSTYEYLETLMNEINIFTPSLTVV